MINKHSVKKDIFSTLKESIGKEFSVIPKSSDIKKQLHESEFPFSFEVPFVLEDDVEDIINMFNSNAANNPEIANGYSLSFKPNTNTMIVKSRTHEINEALIGLINDFQIYGDATQKGSVPLGAQEVVEDEGLGAEISSIMANSPALCPICNSVETVMMGESIYRCRSCSSLFESTKCVDEDPSIKEDKLIKPSDVEDDEKTIKDKDGKIIDIASEKYSENI